MPDTCCVCPSGRKDSAYSGSYHAIPTGKTREHLREQWLKAIPYKDWSPPNTGKLCDLHFSPDDFEYERRDSNPSRHNARGDSLKHKFLKDDAVPHIWPDLPKYLSKHRTARRSDASSAESRQQNEIALKQKMLQIAKEKDTVTSFAELQTKLTSVKIPTDIISMNDADGNLVFVSLISTPLPKVKFSLSIDSNLSFKMVYDDVIIRPTKLFNSGTSKIQFVSDVSTILSFLKNYSGEKTVENTLDTACALIEFIKEQDDSTERSTKLGFILEQLQLAFKPPTGRRYCPATIATCMMWFKTSRALYKMILSDKVLTIPSVGHLERLSSALTVDLEFSGSTIAYLQG